MLFRIHGQIRDHWMHRPICWGATTYCKYTDLHTLDVDQWITNNKSSPLLIAHGKNLSLHLTQDVEWSASCVVHRVQFGGLGGCLRQLSLGHGSTETSNPSLKAAFLAITPWLPSMGCTLTFTWRASVDLGCVSLFMWSQTDSMMAKSRWSCSRAPCYFCNWR